MKKIALILTLCLFVNLYSQQKAINQKQPNVILILTDDQGIGDLACQGNPWLKTPNIDSFYKQAVRMTDFHVSPLCAPTRGALMTGRYPINNGAWATYKGRDALSGNPSTIADIFSQNGYITGMFGKWHLGDNYPVRPTDSGFDVVVQHKAGGVGELSDYWGNNYFNDTYFVNNEPKQFQGYCTDVWFDQTMQFITKNKDKPFFIYLPTNAPHGPLYVEEKYAKPYRELAKNKQIVSAEYYGMLANIDENFGKLEAFLKKNKLTDNTILIYMTDNGTANGISPDGKIGYNKGYNGRKGSKTDGGHRVPFFIRWKDGKISGGKDLDATAAHVDLLPTLASLCNLTMPKNQQMDGIDLGPVLLQKEKANQDRTVFVHNRQDWRPPMDVDETCLIKDNWRLINGKELYDMNTDKMQKNDIAAQHPAIVQQLLANNSNFLIHTKTNPEYYQMPAAIIGNPEQKEIKLTIQHAIGDDDGIWKSEQVAEGMKNSNNMHAIEVAKKGKYRISCRRWPKECPAEIWGIPNENPKNWFTYKTIKPTKVRIQIQSQLLEKQIQKEDVEVNFEVNLEKGKTFLANDFIEGKNKYGVYYTYISLIE
ncbi:arylsulfatase [Flavobacterium ovatum]|uniref:arylsulfatase n=1 Tax=Flavobacterium ovatum TaxID=1928857 RepID=UPI00344C910F